MSQNRRYNSRKILGNIVWTLLGLATVVLLGAAISLRNNKRCKGVIIQITGRQNNFFIDKNEISSILEKLCGGNLSGKTLGTFNLALIENTMRRNEWIKNAELFFDNNEVLQVEVTEREPVARVFTKAGASFYLDSTLARLPISDKTSARVPVFSDFPARPNALTKADSLLLIDVKNISTYILNDPFWMAQIDQVDITTDETFEMIPKVGNQIIVFGKADNYEEKFGNLLTFYKQVATKVGWNTYSKINVQYKGEVVAVKRGAQDMIQDLLRTKQMMQSIVVAAQQQANDTINNIQLDQQPDDNIIPVAPQPEDIPREQPITGIPKPVVTQPVKTVPSSNEKPDPILSKTNVPEKKMSNPASKPFWLQSAATKPEKNIKRHAAKIISTSNERPNPIPQKKTAALNSAQKKIITKPIVKATTKAILKPTTKPKAVMPVNDY